MEGEGARGLRDPVVRDLDPPVREVEGYAVAVDAAPTRSFANSDASEAVAKPTPQS